MLKREQFVRGASLGSVMFQSGLVLGPAIGGALVGWAGADAAYAVASGFGLCAVAALAMMKVTEPPRQMQQGPVFASIREGLRFVFGNQIVLGALALDMFAVLFGGAISLAPAFIKEILHAGPEAVSYTHLDVYKRQVEYLAKPFSTRSCRSINQSTNFGKARTPIRST